LFNGPYLTYENMFCEGYFDGNMDFNKAALIREFTEGLGETKVEFDVCRQYY